MFGFPVWVFVNGRNRAVDGYPYFFMTRGGEPGSPVPRSLPVFTTRALAERIGPGEPFAVMGVDENGFCEILKECPEIENVILDMGTASTVNCRVETLLSRLGLG